MICSDQMTMQHMAEKLLGKFLAEKEIDQATFYKVAKALSEYPHADPESIRFALPNDHQVELRARYTGPGQIGHFLSEGKKVDPQVEANVADIYRDISSLSGVQFVKIYPRIKGKPSEGGECFGYVKFEPGNPKDPLQVIFMQE